MSAPTLSQLLWMLFALPTLCLATTTRAEDLKLEARLIWGTNDEQSPDPKHKKVDEATAKKLTNVFKWKYDFEVNRVTTNVLSRQTAKLSMSKMCELEITELPGAKVEVNLIGQGKKVNKTVETLSKGSYFTVGGPDKNGTAWFVVVTQL